ncbi:MAG: TlpA family protein disulfide reductase [Planctomycetaceae bacterium]|jgi:thiol-disulfide isomerase/thioredoxin|nr:TlpA family protein disulfide reductase [Planctomycetaceae bacterium]
MRKFNIAKLVLFVFAVCFVLCVFYIQRQVKDVKVNAAEQLEKADTVAKIDAFLTSQTQRIRLEQNKIAQELSKLDSAAQGKRLRELLPVFRKFVSDIFNENIQAGEKILTIAKTPDDRSIGYICLIENYKQLAMIANDDIRQKKIEEAGIKPDDPDSAIKSLEIMKKVFAENVITEPQKKLDDIIEQMKKEGKYEKIIKDYNGSRLLQDAQILTFAFSMDKFNKLKSEIKEWSKGTLGDQQSAEMFQYLLEAASSNEAIAADAQIVSKTVKEIIDFVGSEEYGADVELRKEALDQLNGIAARLNGAELNLYGRTLDDKTLDWKALREKFVLVKFTASWCGPCKAEIPNMLNAYKKYHDKGLEIVSVYVFENDPKEAVNNVKKVVKEEGIPWIVVSEMLTQKAGEVNQSKKYSVQSVPTMLLVGKDGKVIATDLRGQILNEKLSELFDKK